MSYFRSIAPWQKQLVRKYYADTSAGQVHVRSWGQADAPVMLLLHWTPLSGRMFEPLAAHFSNCYHVLAPDLPGYGRSDPRPESWQMADWARAMADLLPGPAIVLGGHLGAAVAIEMALGYPCQIKALVLDGIPFLTPELRAALAALPARPAPETSNINSLIHDRAAGLLQEYGLDPTPDRLWPVMLDYLETNFLSSANVLAGFDASTRLPAITQPMLLLGATGDSLSASLDAARQLRPEAAWHRFEGPCPVHLAEKTAAYAEVLRHFFKDLP